LDTELWVPVRFRNERVHARCGADGALLAGQGGFVEFVYQLGGKAYKSRPESFERLPNEAPRAGAAAAPAGVADSAGAPKKTAHTSRVTKTAASKTGVRIVELGQRRGADVAIQLWTDGACSGNPGPAGAGVLYEYKGETRERSEYLGQGTNNIAELTAILRGLEMVDDPSHAVDVMTDSEYCLGLLGLGWKPKANQELVAKLRATYARMSDVLLVKVKGHAGVPGNERADELAREAITSRASR